jgi:ABC-type bacteriocin/lantibiotic exporter with double-glycine peptidase domain
MLRKQIIELVEKFATLSGVSIDHFDLHEQKFRYKDVYGNSFQSFHEQLMDIGEFANFEFTTRSTSKKEFAKLLSDLSFPVIVFHKDKNGLTPMLIKHRSGKKIEVIKDSVDGCLDIYFDTEQACIENLKSCGELVRENGFVLESLEKEPSNPDDEIFYITGFKIENNFSSSYGGKALTPVKRLFYLLQSEKKDIYHLYFFAIMIAMVNLTLPLGIQAIVGLMSGGLMIESVFVLMILVILATLVSGWLQIQQLSLVEILQQRLFAKTAFDFAFRIPRLKLESLRQYYTPELVNRFFDVLNVQKSLPKILIDFTSAIIQIIFGLLLLSFYHVYFIAFGLAVIFVIFLVFYFTSKKGLETSIYESKYKYKVVYWLEELGRSVQSFKLAGNAGLPLSKTDRLLEKYINYRKKHFNILVKQFSAIVVFKTAITAGLLILGGALVFTEQINLGQFVASEIIILLVINSVEKLIGSVAVVYDMLTALDKIAMVTDLEMERNVGRDVADLNINEHFHLQICDLSYKYQGAKDYSFKKVSFEINKGEKVCLAGYNDSGKTTLVKTVAGLFEQYEGVIKLNGISIKELNMSSYRAMIGDNLNISDVFEGTIEENITLGRKGIMLKDILHACQITGLDTFISGLQDGLQAEVSPAGSNFPSNVVKKILLARSFVQHPKLILIDEFFHNVQSNEKRKLFDILFSGEYAILVASSMPEVMQRCDKIIVLKDGHVTDFGNYNELVSRNALPNM